MSWALSVDLRQRIVDAYERHEGTYAQLAERFNVSKKTVYNYVQLYRKTGSVAPLAHTGGKAHQKLFEHHYQAIEAWFKKDPCLDWSDIAALLDQHHDVQVTPSQISRRMKRRGWTRKKTQT